MHTVLPVPAAPPGAARPSAGHPQRDRIVAAVARDFALKADEVTAPTRRAPRVALARQVAMYLAHVGCGLDFVSVGRLFGRDRTTVSHACRVIEDRRDDPRFDARLAALEQVCCDPVAAASDAIR